MFCQILPIDVGLLGAEDSLHCPMGKGQNVAEHSEQVSVADGESTVTLDPPSTASSSVSPSPPTPVFGSFVLAYLLGGALILALVLAAGAWNVLANTRLLSGLIAAGIMPLGEDDPGFGAGVPEVNLWIRSQDPVDWLLVLMAVGLFVAVATLKGLQFHRIARAAGIEGTFGQHWRAYLYGQGLGRMLPFSVGEVAWASALEGQGAARGQASRVVFLLRGFVLFEIAVFAFIGLLLSGVLAWAVALIPPLAILAGAWLFRRERRVRGMPKGARRAAARQALTELASVPRLLVGLAVLSLVSFLFVEVASYVVAQAFSTVTVPLIQNELGFVVVDAPLIVMAVVGGYIARLVQVTPGGIGQFEWAFALVLTTGGLPFPEAAVLALLVSAVRYTTGALLIGGTLLTYGIETNLRHVLRVFQRPRTPAPSHRAPLGPQEARS